MPEILNEQMYPHMVQDYYVARVREASKARDEKLAAIRTREDAVRYCASVKKTIRERFAALPTERTPLQEKVVGTSDRGAYVIEKVLFQSRPGYFVTANLYRPNRAGKHPAVMGLCGHSANGKAAGPYVQFCRSLATNGYVVLCLDPVSQGERYQYEEADKTWKGCDPCNEHNLAGNQMSLAGDYFGAWRAWDAIRGLDYLLSRPEVDATRVGVVGTSGGGTMTTYLNALDDRLTMAATSCFVTTYASNLENELPADSEQYPPGIVGAGLDMGDFYLAQAPRPVIFLSQKFDYFDTRGLQKTFGQVKRIYELLGVGDDVKLSFGPTTHAISTETRIAMYAFFNQHAGLSASGAGEAPGDPETEKELLVTPTGAVTALPGNRRIYEITAENARAIAEKRAKRSGADLLKAIAEVLTLPARPSTPPHYRVLRDRWDEYSEPFQNVQLYGVETEPDYINVQAILHAWNRINPLKGKPSGGQIPEVADAVLYVPHVSSRADLLGGEVPFDDAGAKAGTVFSVDARGIGMSHATTCSDNEFFSLYGADYMYAGYGLMLGESYCGRRVHDVLRTLDLLGSRGTKSVHLVGRGLGAVLGAFAGALHPLVNRVTLKNAPKSFLDLANARVALWPLSSMPRGVLKSFDLPEVYDALREKSLKQIDPWDARMQPQK